MKNASYLLSEFVDHLKRWSTATLEERWALVEWAEDIEEELEETSRDEPATQRLRAALDIVAIGPAQFFLPKDVPAVLALLESRDNEAAEALHRFEQYWKSVDFDAREAEVQRFWFGSTDS